MFFNSNAEPRPRGPSTAPAPARDLRRALRALVRESLVAARRCRASPTRADSRHVTPHRSRLVVLGRRRAVGNRGGPVGAWIADLLLYLFGASAWWWFPSAGDRAGVVRLPRAGRCRATDAHPRCVPPDRASCSSCSRAPRSRRCACRARRRCRSLPAARSASLVGAGSRALRLQRRDAAAARAARGGLVAVLRHLVAAVMERIGARPRRPASPACAAARGAPRPPDRREGREREQRVLIVRERRRRRCASRRRRRAAPPAGAEERARGQGTAEAAVRPTCPTRKLPQCRCSTTAARTRR